MSWFKKIKTPKIKVNNINGRVPEGLWMKCDDCKEIVFKKEIEKNFMVCPKCNYHFRVSAQQRISWLVDQGSFKILDNEIEPNDPLKFRDLKRYKDRLKDSQKTTGLKEAIISGEGTINNYPVQLCVFEFKFMGGSMGSVVGEKITRAIERSIKRKTPLIIISCSGGARMQEGVLSLMQMAKTSMVLTALGKAGLPFISILADPTTGGVTASFAMLGDVIIAEPKALIGFAGPRVIEQTIQEKLPEGFQRAEFLLEHGMVDMVVNRKALKGTVAKILHFFNQKTTV